MKEMGMDIRVIRAGRANMFLSPIFRQTLANSTGASIELYDTDGALGAARGAAVGAGIFASFHEAFESLQRSDLIHPLDEDISLTGAAYGSWLSQLKKHG